jgi:putative DNA primase/helicase
MIEGSLEWRRIGLAVPKIVSEASAEYLGDQDALGQWLEARVRKEHDHFTLSKALFDSWRFWAGQRNLPVGTEIELVASLKDRGFEKDRREYGRGFKGIQLKTVSEMEV